jgi:hypothetical protein
MTSMDNTSKEHFDQHGPVTAVASAPGARQPLALRNVREEHERLAAVVHGMRHLARHAAAYQRIPRTPASCQGRLAHALARHEFGGPAELAYSVRQVKRYADFHSRHRRLEQRVIFPAP